MQRKVFWLAVAVLVLGGLVAGPSQAQMPPPVCKQALEEAQKANQLLQRAAPVIRDCPNDTAKFLFRRAVQVQGVAITALRNRHCVLALELTGHARRVALKALSFCGPPGEALPPSGADPGE